MSTPTEQFAHLSIDPYTIEDPMASPEEVRARATQVQDILSSFFEDTLPSEFQPQIMRNIDDNMSKSYQNRPKDNDWTISGDLGGTLLQWGAYNDAWFERLAILKSQNSLANSFLEELHKRFVNLLGEYDKVIESPPGATELVQKVQNIASTYMELAQILHDDWARRKATGGVSVTIEVKTLQVALESLQGVCGRTSSIVPASTDTSRPRTRRNVSATRTVPSLFTALIIQNSDDEEPFLLSALELFSGTALKQSLGTLKMIDGQLDHNDAPTYYLSRFEALQALASQETPTGTTGRTAGGSSGRESGLEAEPKPGSKRPQAAVETTPKRGKRTGGR